MDNGRFSLEETLASGRYRSRFRNRAVTRTAGLVHFHDSSWGLRPSLYADVRFADSSTAWPTSRKINPLFWFLSATHGLIATHFIKMNGRMIVRKRSLTAITFQLMVAAAIVLFAINTQA